MLIHIFSWLISCELYLLNLASPHCPNLQCKSCKPEKLNYFIQTNFTSTNDLNVNTLNADIDIKHSPKYQESKKYLVLKE